jgi:phospholipid/cholesterol/gamma-HCH transport system permease protein
MLILLLTIQYKYIINYPHRFKTGTGRYVINIRNFEILYNNGMIRFFSQLGAYVLLMKKVFSRPEKASIYYNQTMRELVSLGLNSVGIIAIISFFMGAVITLQTAYNTENPIYPTYLIGLGCRDSMILEFSSTVASLILAGKVGSNIASEIGTMRVTEQIDALEIMGVNSASYLILPKIVATLIFNPVLTLLSIVIGIIGGWLAGTLSGVITSENFIYGIQYAFIPYYITYSLIKMVVFAFIITSVSSFQGYYVNGGSLEVGRASTKAVVFSSVLILLFNVILTQLLLS